MAIPIPLLDEILADPWYQKCCLCGRRDVELHHHLIFAGRAVQAKFCILPLCKPHHAIEKRKDVNERLTWIMVNRMTEDDFSAYSKVVNFRQKKYLLNQKYGTFTAKV